MAHIHHRCNARSAALRSARLVLGFLQIAHLPPQICYHKVLFLQLLLQLRQSVTHRRALQVTAASAATAAWPRVCCCKCRGLHFAANTDAYAGRTSVVTTRNAPRTAKSVLHLPCHHLHASCQPRSRRSGGAGAQSLLVSCIPRVIHTHVLVWHDQAGAGRMVDQETGDAATAAAGGREGQAMQCELQCKSKTAAVKEICDGTEAAALLACCVPPTPVAS